MAPPKRAKTNTNNNLCDEGEQEISSNDRKKIEPKFKHEAIILAIDVGSSSALHSENNELQTDLVRSKQVVDWVLSRKIFSESTDQFSLALFGHENTSNEDYPNVYLCNSEFEKARIEWIRMLRDEVNSNKQCGGNYVAALFAALNTMKKHAENLRKGELLGATITIISNFAGLEDENEVMKNLELIANSFKYLGVNLIIIGPNLLSEAQSPAQEIGYNFLRQLLRMLDGFKIPVTCFNFQESLSKLKFFVPKTINPRGQPFDFELGKDFAVRVQMYVKNQETTLKLSFNTVSSLSNNKDTKEEQQNIQQLRKVRRYETVIDAGQDISFTNIDQAPDTAFSSYTTGIPTGQFLEKGKIVRGYRYGSTLAIFNKETEKLTEFPREGKQLQLIQFTRKENILPQFIVSNCRYILPAIDDMAAFNTLSALVQAMLLQNVVAICRYSYNINSNPRLACLIPKFTKKENYPILIHYLMPFRDDFRYYDFPAIISPSFEESVSEYQMDLMDDYINNLMLCGDNGENEIFKKRDVHDPRIQFQCMTLREKALNSNNFAEITPENKQEILEMLSAPKERVSNAKKILDEAKNVFHLELDRNTRMAAFNKTTKEAAEVLVDDLLRPILATLEPKKMDKVDLEGT